MKKIFFFLCFAFIFITCKKKDAGPSNGGSNPPPVIPPTSVKTSYSVDSASTEPGFFLTLTADKKITRDTATVLLGTIPVLLTKLDTLHFGFYVPAINAGNQTLDLKNIDAANTPIVVIRSYTGISNPDGVLTQKINEYNQLTDSILINSINNSVTPADAQFMHQLMDQLTETIKSLSVSEKMNLAYLFQNIKLDKAWGQKTVIDTTFQIFKVDGTPGEIMDQVTQWAKDNTTYIGRASQLVTPLVGALLTLLYTENIYAAAAAFAIAASYFILTKAIQKAATETSNTAAYVNDNLYEKDGNGTSTNPETVEDNQSRWEKFMSKFRTLQKTDNTGLNTDIGNFINASEKLEVDDNTIKTKFENLRSTLANFFVKITTNYPSYISPVLKVAKEKIADAKAKFVTISNISNPKISVVATDDGANGLKLTFTNPDKSITTETLFTFQLSYNQNSINRKVSVTQHAKFIVSSVQVTTSAPTNITYSTADVGGNVTITGSSIVTSRGICYGTTQNPTFENNSRTLNGTGPGSFTGNLTVLNPGVKYYARAFAYASPTTVYGNQVEFTTSSVNLATITTSNPSVIASTTATLGGYISNDGGAPISERGLCYGPTLNPTYENSLKTINGSGTGTFLSFLSGLIPSQTYHARAYAINLAGISYGNDISFTTDIMESITIGTQVWADKNLNVSTYRNGDPIPQVTDPTIWQNLTTGAWRYYNNDPSTGAIYGKLYNWYAITDPRGLAPTGWRVPNYNDWSSLANNLGGITVAGGKLKSTGTSLWLSPNTDATNSSGFTALPAGEFNYSANIPRSIGIGEASTWWTVDEINGGAWVFVVNYNSAAMGAGGRSKYNGHSVRCIKE